MIVTSKRCFLNILVQQWQPQRVLNANYYIGDQNVLNGFANINDQVGINEYGQLYSKSDPSRVGVAFASKWHIKLSKCLDPEPFKVSQIISGLDDNQFDSAEERFVNHLNNPDTFLAVYNFLFKDQLEGNGLQVFMLSDDPNMLQFGHIICQYLSMNFGVDIVYIDPMYRPNCRGYAQYTGNKELGAKTLRDVRDYDMIFNFNQALSLSNFYSSVNNVSVFLSELTGPETARLYNLLFPDDPLPPGNYYELDHLRQIIIGRCTAAVSTNRTPNLMLHDWQSVVARSELEDIEYNEYCDDSGLY